MECNVYIWGMERKLYDIQSGNLVYVPEYVTEEQVYLTLQQNRFRFMYIYFN